MGFQFKQKLEEYVYLFKCKNFEIETVEFISMFSKLHMSQNKHFRIS